MTAVRRKRTQSEAAAQTISRVPSIRKPAKRLRPEQAAESETKLPSKPSVSGFDGKRRRKPSPASPPSANQRSVCGWNRRSSGASKQSPQAVARDAQLATHEAPCVVRDRSFFNPHFRYSGCRISPWFAGLPAAVCGWKLEAVKRAGGNPPVLLGAGYNEIYTANAGHFFQQGEPPAFRVFSLI